MTASEPFETMEMDIGRAVHTLTKALDYVGIDDRSHGRRVGLMCHRVAHYLGWDQEERHFILLAGMLHDCGVSSTAMHQKLIDELEWKGANVHCDRGAFFLNSFEPFKIYAEPIRYHHTRWIDLPDALPKLLKDRANLIFLVDRLDVLVAKFLSDHSIHEVLMHSVEILEELAPYAGTLFSESLFRALQEAATKDSFWLEIRDEYLDDTIFETLDFVDHTMRLDFDEVEALGELISMIVDAKSPFTHFHSLRVADLTYTLSGLLGYGDKDRRILRIAGLLHDVGKLRTPDEILEKPGALTRLERSQMREHPLDSKQVLRSIFPNTPIARWASEHHEKLDGSGYPFGWTAERIDQPTRILTIADIFQALVQKRPYRDRLQIDEVLAIMDVMRDDGKIDPDIYALLVANKEEFYQIAIREGRSR